VHLVEAGEGCLVNHDFSPGNRRLLGYSHALWSGVPERRPA
jgi:hypothetical protein